MSTEVGLLSAVVTVEKKDWTLNLDFATVGLDEAARYSGGTLEDSSTMVCNRISTMSQLGENGRAIAAEINANGCGWIAEIRKQKRHRSIRGSWWVYFVCTLRQFSGNLTFGSFGSRASADQIR